MIDPSKIIFAKQRLYIPVTQFAGLTPQLTVNSAGSIGSNMEIGLDVNTAAAVIEGGSGITAARVLRAPVKLSTVGAGTDAGTARTLEEISTTGLVGLLMATAGDDVRHSMPMPTDWDRDNDINVRAWWTSAYNTTVTDQTATWKFLYGALAANSGVLAAPATALGTAIAADPPAATAYTIQATAWGTIAGKAIADTADWFNFLVELDAIGGTFTEAKYLMGVEFQYTPRFGNNTYPQREAVAWQA